MGPSNRTVSRREFVAAAARSAAVATFLAGRNSAAAPGETAGLRAGAATVDVTPGTDVSLDGTIMRIGPVRHVHDRLYVRALVLDDGHRRIAIAVCDATMISREILDKAKGIVSERTGLPAERMLISATHTHMAPRSVALGLGEGNDRYEASLSLKIAEAVCLAIDRLAPAKIGWGVGSKPEFARNRRWIMKPGTVGPNPFGERTDRVVMGGRPVENRLKTAGPVDPDVSVLSVRHADGRPLALLANYSIHYVSFKRGEVSADYFGCFAQRVEQRLGTEDGDPPFVAMMTNGNSGDTGSPGGGFEGIRSVGNAVADEVLRVYGQIEHRDGVSLAMRETELELGVRVPGKDRIEWARQVQAGTWNKPAHGWCKVYAHNILRMAKFAPSVKIKLQALRIGELGVAACPCEVFAETGLALKRESPLKPAFHVELANGFGGYLPPPAQHELGGYTTWPALSSFLEIEAEPKIRAELLRLLHEIKEPT